MKTLKHTLRRTAAAATLLLAAPLLVSCGFDFPTDQVYTPSKGVNDRSGSVDVLHALVVSGSDGNGTLVATLVNNDNEQDDALAQVKGVGEEASLTFEQSGPVDVPANQVAQVADEGITVSGERVKAGNFVEVRFSFERGDAVTMQVPVLADGPDFEEIGTSNG